MRVLLFLLVSVLGFNCFSQYSSINQEAQKRSLISTSVSIQKFDVFSSFSYDSKFSSWNFNSSLGLGVNRTFYQQSIFPQIQTGLSYLMLGDARNFQIGPEIVIFASSFKNFQRHYFFASQIGYFLTYGKKWTILNRVNLGLIQEIFQNTNGQISKGITPNFQFLIGIGYVLD
jgi:hypothetical protein